MNRKMHQKRRKKNIPMSYFIEAAYGVKAKEEKEENEKTN